MIINRVGAGSRPNWGSLGSKKMGEDIRLVIVLAALAGLGVLVYRANNIPTLATISIALGGLAFFALTSSVSDQSTRHIGEQPQIEFDRLIIAGFAGIAAMLGFLGMFLIELRSDLSKIRAKYSNQPPAPDTPKQPIEKPAG
ncbi:MAG TPA: hypothetical protein VMU16_13475 [Candidatus Binataceae bacterium]|nr:hypothetical protein [Candidatus Binataceae bacterium]